MIIPSSFVFFLLIHMSCSSKTDCFMIFQVSLLLKLCRLYQRKHISQKCLRSTLWTAQLPKSNLKWRTTFPNILSELHMDISQTQDWAAEGTLNSPSALHSAHHWCLTTLKSFGQKKSHSGWDRHTRIPMNLSFLSDHGRNCVWSSQNYLIISFHSMWYM